MRKVWMMIGMLALAGCATYSELQQRPADYTAQTEKAPQAFIDCLLPKIVDMQSDAHAMRDGDATVIVMPISGHGGHLAATISASPISSGSRVELRNAVAGNASKPWTAAQSCI